MSWETFLNTIHKCQLVYGEQITIWISPSQMQWEKTCSTLYQMVFMGRIKPFCWKKFGQLQGLFCFNILFYHLILIHRNLAYIHDSYRCLPQHRKMFGKVHPFPTQNKDGCWLGIGPTRLEMMNTIRNIRCPKECRPKQHPNWKYCWFLFWFSLIFQFNAK